jgi:hypothetical protein
MYRLGREFGVIVLFIALAVLGAGFKLVKLKKPRKRGRHNPQYTRFWWRVDEEDEEDGYTAGPPPGGP